MRQIAITGAVLASVAAIVVGIHAQGFGKQQRGRVSPHERVTGSVDGAQITIVYGRPSMRGRTIFGTLVPFGEVWCPGADEATTLESNVPLQFGALRVPAGPHTIWMLPAENAWTLIVSKERSGFHTQYHANQDLGRVSLRTRTLETPVEQLTFAVTPVAAGGGEVMMRWERTEVAAAFTVSQ